MFVLSKFKYTAKILPLHLGEDFLSTLIKRIDADFANYVIIDVGLCLSFYDFQSIGASYLMAGDASSYTPVEFRYLVFQPFRGEVIQATISSCTTDGVKLTMDFFSDIFVTPDNLPEVSKFDEKEQVWIWEFQSEEGGDPVKFYMEPGKTVKFRVTDIKYRSVQPGASSEVKVMEITGTMSEHGLGCVDWWAQPAEPEDDAEPAES
ncbi:unnamed protein product [Bursaphelenchus xylophilus]|uniref:(pine wood nematode) hypothetical protein n=1 Tax=Bursaphelenchus xylophilus TaxID=6326 RepID=A0A1I7SE06_BURXY|nr:unnamed protein product [Bursaphelenchus xylophilus]CAG9113108.1 unnamed protein product [Bursaphelenchus xylophilus]